MVVKVNQNNTSVGRKTKTMIDLTDQSCWVKAELAVILCGRPLPFLHMKKNISKCSLGYIKNMSHILKLCCLLLQYSFEDEHTFIKDNKIKLIGLFPMGSSAGGWSRSSKRAEQKVIKSMQQQ